MQLIILIEKKFVFEKQTVHGNFDTTSHQI